MSQWWKAWLLLTSLGATALGWAALSRSGPPVESVVVAPITTSTPTHIPPARRVTMPQKPVFQAPVTRTRRS